MYYYSYYLYMIPAFILMLITQFYVSSAYKKWSQVPNRRGLTGLDAAQSLIRTAGLYNVEIERMPGNLTDNYDPRRKVLRLSDGVARSSSVASLAIAAHELGHAMQDQEDYFPLRLRAALVPAVNIGSYLGWILIILGLIINLFEISYLGLAIFSGGAIFALATIPVELNASHRARALLTNSGLIVEEQEKRGVNKVLNAAALTYVAALVTAVMQLLYWATRLLGRRR